LGRGAGDRPVKIQIIIALVAGLILVAVPLYLWRRPRPEAIPVADAAMLDAGVYDATSPIVAFDAGVQASSLTLSPFTSLKCENPGPGRTPPERCDHVMVFEDALAHAIRDAACPPPASKNPFSISYVMESDFRRKKLTLFTGKSTTLKRDKAKDLIRCIKSKMSHPDWSTIPHQYSRYKVNVVATYPPSNLF
jgi:hypothetical protein